jgi:hypothetical protein
VSAAAPATPELAAATGATRSPKRVLNAVVLVALGGLLVALAYACNRTGRWGATELYWIGQALIVVPVGVRVLSPGGDLRERVLLLVSMAAVQSMLAWAYSPDQFRFPDELQHFRTATDILTTHHLFTPNSYLAVSPGFPGMEEVAVALVQLTGMSLFAAGVVTASAAHVILPVCVVLLFQAWTRNPRISASAAFVYALAPHYAYFNTLFVYSAVALPFLVLAVRAAIRSRRDGASPLVVVAAFVPVIITHHLTAFAGVALLLAFACLVLVSERGGRAGWRLLAAAIYCGALTVAWTALRSPDTFDYLGGPVREVIDGITRSGGGSKTTPLPPSAPPWESLAAMLAVATTAGMVLAGVILVFRLAPDRFLRLSSLLGLSYFGLLLVRLVASDGAELATRAMTYGMLLSALPVAVCLTALWTRSASRLRAAAAVAAAGVVAVGAVVMGLPPSWERLPGHFQVAAYESGVDRQVAAMGTWAADTLPPDQRVACDFSDCSMMGGYAHARISTSASAMFYAPSGQGFVTALSVLTTDYAVVDRRWTTRTPVTGRYFFRDVQEGKHKRPLQPSLLAKFDAQAAIDRVYDNGAIQVYDTRKVWNGGR